MKRQNDRVQMYDMFISKGGRLHSSRRGTGRGRGWDFLKNLCQLEYVSYIVNSSVNVFDWLLKGCTQVWSGA